MITGSKTTLGCLNREGKVERRKRISLVIFPRSPVTRSAAGIFRQDTRVSCYKRKQANVYTSPTKDVRLSRFNRRAVNFPTICKAALLIFHRARRTETRGETSVQSSACILEVCNEASASSNENSSLLHYGTRSH